jgi:HD-GYP domain-containing protein (c-di-GMP phosphodiesterase class II)
MLTVNNQTFIPISLFSLIENSLPGVNIYACAKNDHRPILLTSETERINLDKIGSFESEGVYNLYVSNDQFEQFQEHLRSNWERFLEDETLPLKSRLANIMEISRDLIAKTFVTKKPENLVRVARSLSRVLASLINRNQPPLRDLLDTLRHDDKLATHSVNAACFAIFLAESLGYPLSDLCKIGTGVLLHDVGMLELDPNVVKKPRKLDEFERKEIAKHSSLGFKLLCTVAELSREELMIVYQHHERVDGKGYPAALVQSEIHPWARLCSVVDTFEAVTSDRPQRQRLSVTSAIAIMQRESDNSLDPTFVDAWIRLVEAEKIT